MEENAVFPISKREKTAYRLALRRRWTDSIKSFIFITPPPICIVPNLQKNFLFDRKPENAAWAPSLQPKNVDYKRVCEPDPANFEQITFARTYGYC